VKEMPLRAKAIERDIIYDDPQVAQLVAAQELQEEPLVLENSPSLLWLKVESNFLTFFPVQPGQEIS
jgi:hypothetical protein